MREEKVGERLKSNKGFTLVELVIVVAIMAILVGILAPQYIKYVERARKAADIQSLNRLVDTFKMQVIDAETTGGNGKLLFTPGHTYAFVMWHNNQGNDMEFKKSERAEKMETYDPYGTNRTDWGSVPTNYGDASEEKAMREVLGTNWREVSLKSSKWGKKLGGNKTLIWVLCYISPNESVEIKYCPLVETYLKDEDGVSTK